MKYKPLSVPRPERVVTWFAANCSAIDYGIAKFFLSKFFAGAMNPRKL